MDFHHLSPAGFSGAHLPFDGRCHGRLRSLIHNPNSGTLDAVGPSTPTILYKSCGAPITPPPGVPRLKPRIPGDNWPRTRRESSGYDTFPRVKSPKRRKIRPARPPAPVQLPLFAEAASLIRVRPERNEWRFYRLEIWPDLFGHALLVRQWGRIGTEGRRRLEPHPDPGAAINAPARLAAWKRDRGYWDRAA
jgi:predicted DNA-binding WGR domain protein